jgi:tetratricopeptide (TPR) repeat protein
MMSSSFQSDGACQRVADILYQNGYRLHAEERYPEAAAIFATMLRASPTDERGWLALGDCHEKLGQRRIALELYSAGSIAAAPAPRCELSRFRALYDWHHVSEAQHAYDQALRIATVLGDETLFSIVENERRIRP